MRLLLVICSVLIFSTAAVAQDNTEDEATYLENLLEDSLSGLGREVRVRGFRGALSSSATMAELTIADADGVWLTLHDASLIWTRSALLRGRLVIDRMTAREITVSRLPGGEEAITPDDAVAQPFSLPDLPVSVNIGEISAGTVKLAAPVIGASADLSLTGSLSLAGGDGAVSLNIQRLDAQGELSLQGNFSNETRILALDLNLTEGQGGIAANLLRIPEQPALALKIAGDAPLSDFEARIALQTDNQTRLSGNVRLTEDGTDDDSIRAPARLFSADLSGDLRPLFTDDLKPFFGQQTRLNLVGRNLPDGTVDLETLHIGSAALDVNGSLMLAADGWPQKFSLHGQIGGDTMTRLPLPGAPTRIRKAELAASYDAERGEAWNLDLTAFNLSRDDITVDQAQLSANGTITRGTNRQISGQLQFNIDGFTHDDPAITSAIGPTPSGRTDFIWQEGAPLQLDTLQLQSGDSQLSAKATIDGLKDGFPVTGTATLQAADLTRFAALAGRGLAGAVKASITGEMQLFGDAFDADLSVQTTDLHVGLARLDPLLRGSGTLNLVARRDTLGTHLNRLNITTDALNADATGRLNAETGELNLSANLTDLALVEPRLTGPASIETALDWIAGGDLTLKSLVAQGAGAHLTANGTAQPEAPNLPVAGNATLKITNLARFADLAGRAIAGAVDITLSGSGDLQGQDFDLSANLSGTALRTGLPELDNLIDGQLTLDLDAALAGQVLDLRKFAMRSPQVTADISGDGPGTPLSVSAKLANLGRIAPGFNGPAGMTGNVTLRDTAGRHLILDLNATGPGGTTAAISGDVRDYGQTVNLRLAGNAPLGLLNRVIAPRSIQGVATFDVAVDGPPSLSSLSGTANVASAQVALPTINASLNNLTGIVKVAGGRAQTEFSANASTGGTVQLSGPVTLSAPYNADLQAKLTRFRLRDPQLYQTLIDGRIRVSGPLTGGAPITGLLILSETQIQVPSGSLSSLADVPDIRHVNEPPSVRATRARAGLIKQEKARPASFPLDLTILAPNRIFVRGQGLDAELGGQLRVAGTTDNVTPSGVFELIRGRFDILGKRLELTEGLIDLRGAFDPYLRFVAETDADDFTVQVILEGLASNPSILFRSSPDLPEEEIVARLLFGRGLDSISPFQAAQLAAAVAGLSGGSGGIVGGVRDALGLSDLDVRSTEEGGTEVSAGGYISDNIYSSVTADSEGRQEINLNLDLSKTLTIKGRSNTDGESGIGLFFEKDY